MNCINLLHAYLSKKDTWDLFDAAHSILSASWTKTLYELVTKRNNPSTALYRLFLKLCTLNMNAVGTIWQDLSKPSQRLQEKLFLSSWKYICTIPWHGISKYSGNTNWHTLCSVYIGFVLYCYDGDFVSLKILNGLTPCTSRSPDDIFTINSPV